MKKLFYIIILGCMYSCSSGEKHPDGIEDIFVSLEDKSLTIDKPAFETFDYVKLEMTSESVIGDVSKVVIGNERIYVLSLIDPRIFIFSLDGKYINSLKRGNGPGEVLFVSDFEYRNNNLYVLDNYRSIKQYDSDGNYIAEKYKLDSPYFSFTQADDDCLWLFDSNINGKSNHFLYYQSETNSAYGISKPNSIKGKPFVYYNFYNNGIVSLPVCDTIYSIKADKLNPEYVIHFKGRNFFEMISEKKDMSDDEFGKINRDKTVYRWIKDVTPYKSGIYFAFNYDKTYFVKHENRMTEIYTRLVEGLPDINVAAVGYTDNQIVYSLSSMNLLEYKDNNDIPDDDKLKSLYSSIQNEEDNPYLILVPTK